ncbi:sugar phosphate isomerase/epimerase family protein [Paenibacillus mendelii]|uniref:Sugar phosphate isomerase/epimerase family protein n=1 Tax=Paenibacillus mendelii TaxID=206163 RepID=A0ABV6JBK4_9BACL|nr:sugar phosphate isomerase/epimerase [Paenibacillus mendelii]MCQ6558624.1 sugar phosphate isomerase/epimerase [Paenibacillus mendelii]
MTMVFGCQTYTWQMSYAKYNDRLSSILNIVGRAGFRGVEAEVCMLGRFYDDPSLLKEELLARGLELSALTLAEPWLGLRETEEEKTNADRLIQYLSHFPSAKLILVQLPGKDRSRLLERQQSAISCANTVAKRAWETAGLVCAYHPNSPTGSVFRSEEDYKVMFEGLDYRYIGYCPDSGHIARGGMDVLEVFRTQLSRIKHVHYKDFDLVSREWRTMGRGSLPHKDVTELLRRHDYDGWIMVEEESAFAEAEPDQATLENGAYVNRELIVP